MYKLMYQLDMIWIEATTGTKEECQQLKEKMVKSSSMFWFTRFRIVEA